MWPQTAHPGWCVLTLVAFVLLFSIVCFQMFPQIVCRKGVIITPVAFVWLFTTVCFHMPIQSACIGGCIITLFALVRLFSTVCFQVFLQMACLKECIVTLIALVWLFATVCFQMSPKITYQKGYIFTMVTFVCLFYTLCFQMHPQMVFPWGYKFQTGCICSICLHCDFSCASPKALTVCRNSCTAYRQKVSRWCVIACDISILSGDYKSNCNVDMHRALLRYVWTCALWDVGLEWKNSYTVYICKVFLLNGTACAVWGS